MSINSPAKQERIERHLMRQRGAGARTITTSFTSSFQTSLRNVTSSSQEPLVKRVKPNLDLATSVDEAAVASESAKLEPTESGVSKSKKRKRLDLAEDDAMSIPATRANDQEDSFVAGLGKKIKRRAPKTSTVVPALTIHAAHEHDAAETEPAMSRPRRRAATTAEIREAQGSAEERQPIDRKRRAKQTNMIVKKAAVNFRSVCENANAAIERQSPSLTGIETSPKPQPKGRSRKTHKTSNEVSETTAIVANRETSNSVNDRASALIAGPTAFGSSARKRDTVNETELFLPTNEAQNSVDTEKSSQLGRKKARTAKSRTPAPQVEQAVTFVAPSTRQPLKQTDNNVTGRSSSPRKGADDVNGASHSSEHPVKQPWLAAQVKTHSSKQQTLQGQARRAALRPDKPAASEDVPASKAVHEKQRAPRSAALQNVASNEEDIDWLFESHAAPRPVAKEEKRAKPAKTAKARSKIVDIDLDDLLNNIASFAAKERAGGLGKGGTVPRNSSKSTKRM